jgi:hypothetical protein
LLQISLDPSGRDLTRFLWFRLVRNGHGSYGTNDDVITHRFTRLPFGLTCSPFLPSATIRSLATLYHDAYPTASALMDRSTYMDDFANSALHDDDIITIFSEVTSLLNTIHLPMYKWATKSTHLQDSWRTQGLPLLTLTQVRGMGWEPSLTRSALTTQTPLEYCRIYRQPSVKYYKSSYGSLTRSVFHQW